MNRALKFPLLVLCVALLSACEAAAPEPADTAMVTKAPSLTPVIRTSTPTPSVTTTSSPTVPASTSTFAPPASATSPGPNAATESQEAQAFCYQDPQKALDAFLTYLYQGEYERAARLYESSYPFELRNITPEAFEASERIAIVADYFRGLCEGYGTCLKHKIVDGEALADRSSFSDWIRVLPEGDVWIFGVNLFYENGEIFESIPPAGVPGGRHTLIGFVVARLDGCFKSIDQPPITP